MSEYVTIKVTKEVAKLIQEDYSSFLVENNGEYVLFCASLDTLQITAYTSKKETITVTFKGESALEAALKYDENAKVSVTKERIKTEFVTTAPHIGSDEVGVGDFFGPVVVAAAYVDENSFDLLKELGIDDSKKISDKKILEIGPKLLSDFKYSLLICYPEKYNQMQEKGFNMNKIKAWLHNHALVTIKKKYGLTAPIYVDQFVSEPTYYRYLDDAKEVETNINFLTKAESYYPAVALASCIARYTFLLVMEEYHKKYDLIIPYGASSKVSEFAFDFANKFSKEELDKIIKKNFKNYLEVLDKLNPKLDLD